MSERDCTSNLREMEGLEEHIREEVRLNTNSLSYSTVPSLPKVELSLSSVWSETTVTLFPTLLDDDVRGRQGEVSPVSA